MSHERTHVTVACALIEVHGRLLVAKRSQRMSMPGKWEFPGGKIRSDETAESAIVREIAEELGCSVRPTRRLAAFDHHYPDVTVTLVPFVCELVEGEPKALEHAELRWAVKSELLALDWSAADVPILQNYLRDRNAGTN
jgi:8-oxo-dGTP diphosphatase